MQPLGQASWLCSRRRSAPEHWGALSPEVARSFQSTAFLDNEAKRTAGGNGLTRLSPYYEGCSSASLCIRKKEEPGIEPYLAERVVNMEIKGLVTSRLKLSWDRPSWDLSSRE